MLKLEFSDPKTGFGIARSAPVGGSARRALPPPHADPGFWGALFLKKKSKNGFLGGCLCRENRLFFWEGEAVVEKIDFLGSCCRENRLRWR